MDDPRDATGWPLVAVNDDGIRPAGRPDRCFYCQQRVGMPHTRTCVVILKRIRVRYIFTVEIDVPHSWDKDTVEFHRNESSWCGDNALDDIDQFVPVGACLCPFMACEFVEVVDETPKRDLRETPAHPEKGTVQ